MIFSSLAMYDFPPWREDWNRFYTEILRHAPFLPRELTWGEGAYDWAGDVALSMTCGAPLRNQFSDHLHVIGALDFGFTPKGYYQSILLGDINRRPLRVAVNDKGSQSGFHALAPYLEGQDFEIILSGSHFGSMEMLARGEADLCAIDIVSYGFITKMHPELSELQFLGKTSPTPALPICTSHRDWVEALREALIKAVKVAPASLGITDFIPFNLSDYQKISNFDHKSVQKSATQLDGSHKAHEYAQKARDP